MKPLGWPGSSFVIAISAMICIVALLTADTASAYDVRKFCRPEQPNLVLFFDITTPYDERDKSILSDGVGQILENLQGGETITLRTIADSFANSKQLFQGCVPVCQDEGWLDMIFSDCTGGFLIVEKQKFRSNLISSLLGAVKEFPELEHSDILQTLYYVSQEELRPQRNNQLLIFSDMIENSQLFSGQRFMLNDSDFLLEKLGELRLVPNFEGVAVRVFGIGRVGTEGRAPLGPQQVAKLHEFWQRYLERSGAKPVSISQSLK